MIVAVVGIAGSDIGAHSVAQGSAQRAHQAAVTSSLEIATSLELAMQREQDLAINAASFFIANPGVTSAEWSSWVATNRIYSRNPEIQGLAEVVMVTDAQLPGFTARAGLSTEHGTYPVAPAGPRSFYCLVNVTDSRSGSSNTQPGSDLCSTVIGPALLAARDTGQGSYMPFTSGPTTKLMIVGRPFYAQGIVPTTVHGRRDSFLGWTGSQINPELVLDNTLVGHPGTGVILRYGNGSSAVTIRAGHAPAFAESTLVDLHNGWKVSVLAAPIESGVIDTSSALWTLLGGIAVTLLLAILIYVLGTSRSRAFQLVHQRTEELRHQALHDALTGLPNRALILDRIGQMLAQSRRRKTPVAALFMDLDDFKDINDTLGHRAGDELLVEVGARLLTAVRDGDTVGRLGGDEFIVLTEGNSSNGNAGADAEMVAVRIFEALTLPFELSGSDVSLAVSASIGIAEGDRDSPEELLQDADIALYEAKARGKHQVVRFSPAMQEAVDLHRHLEVDLKNALEDEEFFLEYQPAFDLSTGVLTGVEALLRWRHPTHGVVQPDGFVPALEATDLIVPVGAWALHEACRQGASWTAAGFRFTVSVNVSARQLEKNRLLDDVGDALAILDLAETTLLHDAAATATRLHALKDLGVRIAVDDFGTAFSSLAYLHQFPIDVVKIDGSFIAGVADSAESAATVHTFVQLARVLGIDIVAEGVETEDQAVYLRGENVDGAQGFLFAHPQSVDAIGRLLQAVGTDPRSEVAPDDTAGQSVGSSTSR
jgi:diguanylate cyclase (GGDEF)-like protein